MPNVTATPKGMTNGEVVTEFTDTTSTVSVTYTYPVQQSSISIENSGVADIYVTVGGHINQTVKPNKTWKMEVKFSSFSIRSDVNSQEFVAVSFQTEAQDIKSDGGIRLASREKMSIVTFTSDDGRLEDYTKLKPLLQAKGVPCTLGIISELVGSNTYLTLAQVRELEDLGWEVASHTAKHLDLATLTDQQIDDELRISKNNLTSLGFDVKNAIYPYGSHDVRVRKTARKYYRAATSTNPGYNGDVHKTYALNRVAIGAFFDPAATGYPATNTLAYYKQRVDEAVSNNGWLIFMFHPWASSYDAVQEQCASDLIDYIKSLNVPIMNMNSALDLVGNLIDVGDHGSTKGFFAVGSEGKTETNFAYKKMLTTGLNASSPLSAFEKNMVTAMSFSIADNAGFPENGGLLETYNLTEPDYAFQIFYHFDSDRVYRRRWSVTGSNWLAWMKLDPNTIISAANAYTATSPMSDFPTGKITSTKITAAGAVGFPFDVPGLLITNATTKEAGYIRQSYYVYDTAVQRERYWTTAGAWSSWESVVKKLGTTFNDFSFGTIPAQGQVERTFAVTGAKVSDLVVASPRGTLESGLVWSAYVSAVDTIIVRMANVTTAAVATATRTWSLGVIK